MPLRSIRGLAALTATLVLSLACGEVLAPPDGAACTAGSIAPGQQRFGEIDADDCKLWSSWQYADGPSESWTLHAKAHSAYVVRIVAIDRGGDSTNWAGDLSAFTRNRAGDAAFAAIYQNYVANNLRTREMVLVTDRDRDISIRIDAFSTLAFGEYRLEIERCDARQLAQGDTINGILPEEGCTVSAFAGAGEAKLAFFTYRTREVDSPYFTVGRTAGPGVFRTILGGPDLDMFGRLGDGVVFTRAATASPVAISPILDLTGMYTLAIGVTPGQPATVQITVEQQP